MILVKPNGLRCFVCVVFLQTCYLKVASFKISISQTILGLKGIFSLCSYNRTINDIDTVCLVSPSEERYLNTKKEMRYCTSFGNGRCTNKI